MKRLLALLAAQLRHLAHRERVGDKIPFYFGRDAGRRPFVVRNVRVAAAFKLTDEGHAVARSLEPRSLAP